MTNVAFSWSGLPHYGARLLRGFIQSWNAPCPVIGTRPDVPLRGIEEALGQSVVWVGRGDPSLSWAGLGLPTPSAFFQAGWSEPSFVALGNEVRAAGGKVILMMDNKLRTGLRGGLVVPLVFRIRFHGKFDGALVPGRSGRALALRLGFSQDAVRAGLYGSDPALFSGGSPLAERPREILFVGQFIPRKDVIGLCEAFLSIADRLGDWSLRLCGSGPQRSDLPDHPRIQVEDFVQPAELVQRFHRARILVLPSLEENWGLVVNEAAACGCSLVLSDAVGAADDLAGGRNALLFRAGNRQALAARLHRAANWSSEHLVQAEAESRRLAANFGPRRFAESAQAFVRDFALQPVPRVSRA